jgi:hypothetical protein
MSQFECLVSDLKEKPPENDKVRSGSKNILSRVEYNTTGAAGPDENGNGNGNGNENANVNGNGNVNGNVNVKLTLFEKITEQKNINLLLIIIISYFITHSSQFIDFLEKSFPYLVEAGVTNTGGKLIIAIIIGLSSVLITTFFPVP